MYDEELVNIEAAYKLGLAYLYGNEVIENEDLAIIWLQKAAQEGHSDAGKILEIIKRPEKGIMYPEKLIHKTARGEMVRSKSELIIADALFQRHVKYAYEKPLPLYNQMVIHPDFTIYCVSGKIILWEHLGMLDKQGYKIKWIHKNQLYIDNNYVIGKNLFITRDQEGGRIDSQAIQETAQLVNNLSLTIDL